MVSTTEREPEGLEGETPEFDVGREFIKSGGEVIRYYPDGRPALWKCGQREEGEPVDPRGTTTEAIHFLSEKGEWMAGNPDEELIEEIKRWRTDWMDVEE